MKTMEIKIKTAGKEKNYELIEYINNINHEYAELLVEQNINGILDTAYVYGAAIGAGYCISWGARGGIFGRISITGIVKNFLIIKYPAIHLDRKTIAESEKRVTAFYKKRVVACFLYLRCGWQPGK